MKLRRDEAATMHALLFHAGVLAFALVVLAATNARADIFAAVCVTAPAPRTDLDVAVLNATTGVRLTLPATVNTTAQELHPSISASGKRLAFERFDSSAGTRRIIVVDRSTGASADLFTGFEAAQDPPTDPAITPDGTMVATGTTEPFVVSDFPRLTLTNLQLFPTGPFSHTTLTYSTSFLAPSVVDVAAGGGNLFAFQLGSYFGSGGLVLLQLDGTFSAPLSDSFVVYANPAMAANNPQFVLFDTRPKSGTGKGDILFRPATVSTFVGPPTALPRIVNSGDDESQPAVTADGRYVAFVRRGSDLRDRLFVWDSQTQTLLNTTGVDLGGIGTAFVGAVSLYTKTLFTTTSISGSGTVTGALTGGATVGILVQRILGRTRILMRPAYELETVGRVPLGDFPKGKFRTQWDRMVDGEPLDPGHYLVTVRAVEETADGVAVRELSRPHLFVIPERH